MKLAGLILLVVVVAGVASLAGLYLQVPRYRTYWQRRATNPPAQNALVYVALGDSAAQGVGASSPQKGYVGLVADALAQKHGRPVHVINLSKSGARVHDAVRDQLPQLQHIKADVVTIEIGANNMTEWDEQQFRADIEKLVSSLPPQTVISDLPYFGGGRYRRMEPAVQIANGVIHEAAQAHGLRLAPLYAETKDHDSWRTRTVDLFHPSGRGYRNWFNAFWQVLGQ